MKRLENWPTRLVKTIDAAASKPFVWGEHDCCLFACDCILAVTGVDPAAPFRGKYSSKTGAVKALRDYAGNLEDVVEKITRDLRMDEILEARAGRGDLALLESELGEVLGIHYGGAIFSAAPDGLARAPVYYARRHWAV
jgi:hypothetical protein